MLKAIWAFILYVIGLISGKKESQEVELGRDAQKADTLNETVKVQEAESQAAADAPATLAELEKEQLEGKQ